MKLRIVRMPRQQFPASRESFGGSLRVAQHCDRRLRRLDIFRIERDCAIESVQRSFECTEGVAAGAEEKPSVCVGRIANASGFEKR